MPKHIIPAASLDDELLRLRREGHVIVACQRRRSVYEVVTMPETVRVETRPAHKYDALTHAARVGAMETRAEWDRDPLLHSFLTDAVVTDGDA